MKAIHLILVAFAAALLTGCVSTKVVPINAEQAKTLKSSTLSHTNREEPSFIAYTYGKALFGLVGLAAMQAAGNKIVNDNNVPKPTAKVSQQLTSAISSKFGSRVVSNELSIDGDDVDNIAEAYASTADYVVDVDPLEWGFIFRAGDLTHYDVFYKAKIRLIDTRSKASVAESACLYTSKDRPNPPTRDELLADQAARLKSELDIGVASCVERFQKEALQAL